MSFNPEKILKHYNQECELIQKWIYRETVEKEIEDIEVPFYITQALQGYLDNVLSPKIGQLNEYLLLSRDDVELEEEDEKDNS